MAERGKRMQGNERSGEPWQMIIIRMMIVAAAEGAGRAQRPTIVGLAAPSRLKDLPHQKLLDIATERLADPVRSRARSNYI